ncbi:MAG TPA: nuclear transport factor 2 family protein [Gammaproteobacteria bacterium]|nr:nuclear transport factor 2 family protein [Gammaproteobacteria bacterium]
MMMKRFALFIALFFCVFSAFAQNAVPVEVATQNWAAALSSNNPQKIADMYASGALLYATFENQLDTPEGIEGYFAKLMKHKDLAVKFGKQNIRMFGETALNSGFYTFSYMLPSGKIEAKIPARYTFVFAHEADGWKIVEHHSSVLPQ